VVISGGVLGKITDVSDSFIQMEVADGVNIKVQKNAVANVMPKGTIKFDVPKEKERKIGRKEPKGRPNA
jgi:preprotein translocase subunit YajC